MALVASGKFAISTTPATVNNSSSQSSRLSWHPSQEANFQTATFGLRSGDILDLPFSKYGGDAVKTKNGSVFADERRSVLAVATITERALHIALHRKVYAFLRNASLLKFHHGKTHHHFRPAEQSYRVGGVERRPSNQRCDYTNVAAPSTGRTIHGHLHFQIKLAPPPLQFPFVKYVFRRPCAVKQYNLSILFPLSHHLIEHGTQWGQPDSSGYDHEVAPVILNDRPVSSVRAAHTDQLARS